MDVDDLLPLSGLQHLIFCERQFALIHVEQTWAENALTISGRQLHERADLSGEDRSGSTRVARALPLASPRLGLAGKADVVKFRRESAEGSGTVWRPFPIEYKRGRPKPGGADEVQLCAMRSAWRRCSASTRPAGPFSTASPGGARPSNSAMTSAPGSCRPPGSTCRSTRSAATRARPRRLTSAPSMR